MQVSRRAVKKAEVAIKADRSRQLGLLALFDFRRFVRLYRKYNPDQPRDDRGRWVETGVDDEVEETGAVVVRKYRTGDPRIDSVTAILENKAADALEQVGPGRGPDYGRDVHVAFATSVVRADIPGIRAHGVEVTFLEGTESPYGTHGSVRTDVILRAGDGRDDPVVAVWDLKTGSAVLSSSRAAQIRSELRVDLDVPVIELHAIRGISVKEYDGIAPRPTSL